MEARSHEHPLTAASCLVELFGGQRKTDGAQVRATAGALLINELLTAMRRT